MVFFFKGILLIILFRLFFLQKASIKSLWLYIIKRIKKKKKIIKIRIKMKIKIKIKIKIRRIKKLILKLYSSQLRY